MRSVSLAFLVGVCLLQFFSYLPDLTSSLLLLIPVMIFIGMQFVISNGFLVSILKNISCVKGLLNKLPIYSLKLTSILHQLGILLCAVILGFSWSLWRAHWILDLTLPSNINNTETHASIKSIGTITSIPEQKNHAWHFTFAAIQLSNQHYSHFHPLNLRISWYGQPAEHLRVGDLWQLQLTLTQSHGFTNPGSFDYGRWLFEQHIRSTATVQNNSNNLLLRTQQWQGLIDRYRQLLNEHINNDLIGLPVGGMINALSVGIRDQITPSQWQILRNTGTNHLMAIAGLHIGFISGMAYYLCNFLWRRIPFLTLLIPAQQCARLAALCSAFFYSALAGFSLPTQRAALMLSIFLLATLLRRHIMGWQAWSLALIAVLLWDPLASFSSSFWLSFGTVALIIYGTTARLNTQDFWWRWGQTQWVISLGLLPLSLLFFQQFSLIGFIANSIAIPCVGFIILPLSFLGSLLLMLLPTVSKWILILAEHLLNYLWIFLQALATQPQLQWYRSLDNVIIFFTLLIGIILLLAPRGWPARWLGLCWTFPLFFWQPSSPLEGTFTLSFLDTGANTVAVIRTSGHTLLYETHVGPQQYIDINNTVILPYLRIQGIKHIDMLISNHVNSSNRDKVISINPILNPYCCNNNPVDNEWMWDKISFIYSAPISHQNKTGELKISNGQTFVVLNDKKGSIITDRRIVYSIISSYTAKDNFVDDIASATNTPFYNTLNCGAIKFTIGTDDINPPSCYKKAHPHFW